MRSQISILKGKYADTSRGEVRRGFFVEKTRKLVLQKEVVGKKPEVSFAFNLIKKIEKSCSDFVSCSVYIVDASRKAESVQK